MLKVGEFVRVPALLVLEAEKGIFLKPERRYHRAFLVCFQLQGQPQRDWDLMVGSEGTYFALGFRGCTERR